MSTYPLDTGLDDKLRGLVKGGLTFIKALRGQGKTELVRYFEVALLKQNTSVAMLHMEEMKSTTYRAMATYELGWNVRTKEDAIATQVSLRSRSFCSTEDGRW
jgi:KaiC/GvpD/RAD55 family RecA-like ATPase